LEPLRSLHLWGDGDEWRAVKDAFRAVHLEPPKEDALKWLTVGDLWKSVLRLTPKLAGSKAAWDDFRRALAAETAVDWSRITAETKLLDGRGSNVFTRLMTAVRERIANKRA
jgi:hypothetical protein